MQSRIDLDKLIADSRQQMKAKCHDLKAEKPKYTRMIKDDSMRPKPRTTPSRRTRTRTIGNLFRPGTRRD